MVQTVELPNGDIHEFPDEATPDQMKKALSSYLKPNFTANKDDFDPSFIEKLAPNIIAGLAQGGHELLNTPYKVAKQLEKSDSDTLASKLGIKAEDIPHQEDFDYAAALKLPSTASDKIVRGAAQFAPALLAPEAEIGEAGNLLSKIPGFGKYLKKSAQIGTPQAAIGATQNENPIEGAAEGAATGLIAPGLEKLINALRPSKILRGNLSPEELKTNLEATEGTNTGLGRIVGSPTLNRAYENILPHIIGSGAEDTMQKTANQISNKGENLLEKIRDGLNPGDLSAQLQSALKTASIDARKAKNQNYEIVNSIADKNKVTIGRENFKNAAMKALSNIKESPELESEVPSDIKSSLGRYTKKSTEDNIASQIDQPGYAKTPSGIILKYDDIQDILSEIEKPEGASLKLSNIFKGKLNDKANEYYRNGQMYEYGIMKDLKTALSEDINNAIDNSPHKELKDAYQKAEKDYAEKFAPFEDKDIVKFTRQGGDPDLILPHFLRGGKNDRANILRKLTTNLPRKHTKIPSLMSYAYLSKAVDNNGQIDPLKLSGLYRSLGENQKKALIQDEGIRNDLEKFSTLVGKNKESFDLMRNPKTGARNTDLLIKLLQVGAGSPMGLAGAAASTIGTGLAGRAATKALTSEKLRTSLIKKMIENKDLKLPGRMAGSGLLNSLMNSNNGE